MCGRWTKKASFHVKHWALKDNVLYCYYDQYVDMIECFYAYHVFETL
jgi:hypothetical protein